MSLYDGVGLEEGVAIKGKENALDASKIANWSSGLQFMKTQLQLKKASKVPPLGRSRGTVSNNGPGSMTLANLTGREPKTIFVDEYDPLRPNDYDRWKEKQKERDEHERRQKDKERERQKDRESRDERKSRFSDVDSHDKGRSRDSERDRNKRDDRDRSRERRRDRSREDDNVDKDNRRRDKDDREKRRSRHSNDDESGRDKSQSSRGGAAIAPPPSLVEIVAPSAQDGDKKGAGTGGFSTGNMFATQIMARYGWKEGRGLGKDEQGLSTCLQVEKTSRRGGKIINKDKIKPALPEMFAPPPPEPEPVAMPPPVALPISNAAMRNPSKVALLKNMVGPGEVDDDLQPEVEEECQKYGEVARVIIFEIPGNPADEAVRIFVEFKRVESATKAIIDLNGRYFGGRLVKAAFYNLDRFRRLDLQHD